MRSYHYLPDVCYFLADQNHPAMPLIPSLSRFSSDRSYYAKACFAASSFETIPFFLIISRARLR